MIRSGLSLIILVGVLVIAPCAARGAISMPWNARSAAAQVEAAKRLIFEDSREAETLLRKAAAMGSIEAEGLLGHLLLMRCRAEPSPAIELKVEALKWISLGAKHGDKRAQADFAGICLEGRLVQQNLLHAWMWGDLAAQGSNVEAAAAGRTARDAAAQKLAPEELAVARRKAASFTFNLEKHSGFLPTGWKGVTPLYAAFICVGILGAFFCARMTMRAIANRPRRFRPGRRPVTDLEVTIPEERFYRILKLALPLSVTLSINVPLHDVVRPKTKLHSFLWRAALKRATAGKYLRCALRDVETLRVLASIEVKDADNPREGAQSDKFIEGALRYSDVPVVVVAAQANYSVQEVARQLEDLLGLEPKPTAATTARSGLKMANPAAQTMRPVGGAF